MSKLILSVGIPGSGKSTLLKEYAKLNNLQYINPDTIRKNLTGRESNQERNPEVWELTYKKVIRNLKQGKVSVIDATYANHTDRRAAIKLLKDNGADVIYGVYFKTSLSIAKKRNKLRSRSVPDLVIDKMQSKLKANPPSSKDGFDGIITLNSDHKVIKIKPNAQ